MKRYKNKKFIIKLFVAIALVVILVALKPWKQPSQEMLNLRHIEQQLSLPNPKDRIEDDSGENQDWKGAVHYTRYIRLYYDDATNVESIVQQLSSSGWEQVNESESEDSKRYSFVDKSLRACIITKNAPNSTDLERHSIYIGSATDDLCSFYFRD